MFYHAAQGGAQCQCGSRLSQFRTGDRDARSDRVGNNQNGDCLVLLYTTYPNMDDEWHLTDIVVCAVNRMGGKALIDSIMPSPPTATLPKVPSVRLYHQYSFHSEYRPHPAVVELSQGLADGQLFQSQKTSGLILVNAELIHGVNATEVTNTYNLTLAPRG